MLHDFSLQINIGGIIPDFKVFRDLYREVLIDVEKDSFYIDERPQRRLLIDEIGGILEELRPFVELD